MLGVQGLGPCFDSPVVKVQGSLIAACPTPGAYYYKMELRGGRPHTQRLRWLQAQGRSSLLFRYSTVKHFPQI